MGLLVLGYLLGTMQTKARNAGRTDAITRFAQVTIAPAARPLESMIEGWDDFYLGIAHAGRLHRQNRELELKLVQTQQALATETLLKQQIQQLRKLNGFASEPGHTPVAADVIGLFAFDNRLTLDVGSNQGVTPGMAVVSGDGFVGTIQTVGSRTCQVLLVTSPALQIGAIGTRNPPPAGLLRGETSSTLIVEFMDPKTTIQIGDDIVTAGYSQLIPRGIPIGRVIRIEDNPDFGTRMAYVYPWVNIGSLHEVFVLK